MSAKSNNPNWKEICQATAKPGEVKRASKHIKLRDDWETKKIDVMWECLCQKYNQEPFKSKLMATGTKTIQEGNYWNDKFWGVCLKTGHGKNKLGRMIMKIRRDLLKD
jgi:predicted NAD-dependent protein-ADP-ribosyltransferase YbiA (DUF1768 family)